MIAEGVHADKAKRGVLHKALAPLAGADLREREGRVIGGQAGPLGTPGFGTRSAEMPGIS